MSPTLFHLESVAKILPGGRPRLPADRQGGAYRDLVQPKTVTFTLRAPFKPHVSLIGDFNQWDPDRHAMQTDGAGNWWITLADPGETRYGFHVSVDAQRSVQVGDPYAQEVRWDSQAAWAYLPPRTQPFRWSDQDWQTPDLADLTLYELCVRDFSGRWAPGRPVYGNFKDLLYFVDYFADLGINAIELMPIHEFPGDSSWGYNPVFYFAPEHGYGRPDELKQLINSCHRRGIAVILDVVFNHAWGDHPYYQMYPPLFGPQGEKLDDWNPFFHHTPNHVNAWGGVDWDHFSPETTRYFQDVVRYWLTEYRVDGFRFDWVGGVEYNGQDPMHHGFNPFHGISAICWTARQVKPNCILIAEYWSLDGTHPEKSLTRLLQETPVSAAWNGAFHHGMERVLNQRWQWEQEKMDHVLAAFQDLGIPSQQLVNYTCSHDEVRPEHEVKFYSSPHIARPAGMSVMELALAKALLGLTVLFSVPGIPMLYAGQEFGEDTPRTIDFLPLNWQKLQQPAHLRHQQTVKRLMAARKGHPSLRSDQIRLHTQEFQTLKVLWYERWDDHGDYGVVALNFDCVPHSLEVSFPFLGRWREVVQDRVQVVQVNASTLMLEPFSGALFVPD